jgi:ABC-type transport system involved in multi-copper enzyme maturation permease subunit
MGELFLNTMKDLLALRKVVAAAILVALPTAIALIWRAAAKSQFEPEAAYNMLCAGMVFGFILVILSVVYSTSAIAQEVEQKTIVYLLTHAVPRWRILFVKLVAALIATTATVWIASFCLALATFGPEHIVHSRL